jgi:hypothetical protein
MPHMPSNMSALVTASTTSSLVSAARVVFWGHAQEQRGGRVGYVVATAVAV